MHAAWRRGAAALAAVLLLGACGDLVEVQGTADLTLRPTAQTSRMLAADGTLLADLHAEEDRDPVPLSEVPTVVRDAVVAVEDARFRDHAGVDLRALVRALVANASSGRVEQGGSTITQQLAKNAVTGDDVTIDRKVAEAGVALQLERTLTKDEILEAYLNTVYFGNGAYGVETAARRYFGTGVRELGLAEAALLAGLLASPARFDPYVHPKSATERRAHVLDRMSERGLTSPAEADAARAAPLGVVRRPQRTSWTAPWFVSHVLDLLQHDPAFSVLGDDPVERADVIFRGGLEITTTLDPVWQAAAEDAVATTLDRPDDPRGAVVAIDPASGGVQAMVGGRDWNDPDDPVARFNLATQARRQPGSTFKVAVLAAALEAGWTLDRTLPAPGSIRLAAEAGEPEPWAVENYDDVDHGELTLREATAQSVNTVFAQLVDAVGSEAVVDVAERLGVTSELRPLRAIALGAQEVTVLDMASVQATLAAGGVHRPPTVVAQITGPDGTVLYERPRTPGEQVLDPEVAWQLTTALEEAVRSGTGGRADLRRPTAGKTGTTQDTADAWFTGYTPDLAAAVWVGFPEGRTPMEPPLTRVRVEGGTWPAEIFGRLGSVALADVPAAPFAVPDAALTEVTVDLTRDCLPTAHTPPSDVGTRAYLSGTEPTEECDDRTTAAVADVPDVVGSSWEEARATLTAAGLQAVPQPLHTLAVPPGIAVAQNPPAGRERKLSGGFVVRVRVSSADRTEVQVPSVLGLDAAEAVAELERAGFPVDVDRDCPVDSPVCAGPAGVVYEQQPAAGTATIHEVVTLRAYPSG